MWEGRGEGGQMTVESYIEVPHLHPSCCPQSKRPILVKGNSTPERGSRDPATVG